MHDDPRIQAGVNLDGAIRGSVGDEGLDRPLLMLASSETHWTEKDHWNAGWPSNIGLKLPLEIVGTRHRSFDDQQVVLPQLVSAGLLSADNCASAVGTIDARQSLTLQRTYLRTFFGTAFANINIAAAIAKIARNTPDISGSSATINRAAHRL